MEHKQNNIDKLFREAFQGYKVKPNRSVWKGVVTRYLNPILGKPKWYRIGIVLSVLIISGSVWLILSNQSEPNSNEFQEEITISDLINHEKDTPVTLPVGSPKNLTNTPENPNTGKTDISNNALTTEIPPNNNISNTSKHSNHISPENSNETASISKEEIIPLDSQSEFEETNKDQNVNRQKVNVSQKSSNPDDHISSEILALAAVKANKQLTPSLDLSHQISGTTSPLAMNRRTKNLMRIKPLPYTILLLPFVEINIDALSAESIQWKDDYAKPANASLGMSLSPEYVFYRNEKNDITKGFFIDVTGEYHFKDIFLRSGLGFGRSQYNGKYLINYDTYDSIGYYTSISSFSIVPGYPDSVVFNTEVEGVYEFTPHILDASPESHYTSLQIPLLLGYKISEYKKWVFTFSAGPVVSFLIKSVEHPAVFDDPLARNVEIEDQTPTRLKTNWQIMMNLGVQYKLSGKTSFLLEPTYKQYIKSIYSTPGDFKTPYSLGLKFGLMFTL